jgi:ABC-type Fe3+/spermidine/putrescine transport system ATPase subunit
MLFLNGVIRDVIYLGLFTRYLVETEGGIDLVVVEQNLKTTSMDVLSARGQSVRLQWHKDHINVVGG